MRTYWAGMLTLPSHKNKIGPSWVLRGTRGNIFTIQTCVAQTSTAKESRKETQIYPMGAVKVFLQHLVDAHLVDTWGSFIQLEDFRDRASAFS